MMPVWVSPIFMVDVSTAATIVSWRSGFSVIASCFSCKFCRCCSVMLNWCAVCWFSCSGWLWTWLREWMLCSKKRWGRSESIVGCGKLYSDNFFDVEIESLFPHEFCCGKLYLLVIVYCSITLIHQYSISLLVKYLSIVHVHLAQFNIQ